MADQERAGEDRAEPVLCYVEEPWAWFTTAPLAVQWGDDWNDRPYEHNAGTPYEWRDYMAKRGIAPYALMVVAFDGPWETPRGFEINSRWSVQDINAGAVPWLTTDRYSTAPIVTIKAGTGLMEFCRLVRDGGGHIYTEAL